MSRTFARAACLLLLLAFRSMGSDFPSVGKTTGMLTLYSTLDAKQFEPLVRDFQQAHPGVRVRYELLDAMPEYRRFVREADAGRVQADVLISTAMDLQSKLVNDGYAALHASEAARALPSWARWRDEAFGFTFEPAVMVFNREAFRGRAIPQTRSELLDSIRADPSFWKGRIGTYDVSRSSVGYLLASQDVRHSSEFGALVEALAGVDVVLGENSSTLLDKIESGRLVAGYNLLGSYSRARIKAGGPLVLVYPKDHTLVISRTALIPKHAPNPRVAHQFLEYLLSLRGQKVLAERCGLPPIRREIDGAYRRLGVNENQIGLLRPVALGPGLLVYLDRQKRQRMLAIWRGVLEKRDR